VQENYRKAQFFIHSLVQTLIEYATGVQDKSAIPSGIDENTCFCG